MVEARRRAPVLLLALGLSLVLLAVRDVVRDLILDPALRVFLFLEALPRVLVWLLAVGLFVVFAWRLFSWPSSPRAQRAGKQRGANSSLAELVGLIRRSRFSPWARRALRARLARVALALRCERERISPQEAWEDFTHGRWPEHPRVAAFLQGKDTGPFEQGLRETVEALERYAAGGEL